MFPTLTRCQKFLTCWSFALLAWPSVTLGQAQTAGLDDPSAREIVRKSDQIRLPSEGFEMEINIKTSRDGVEADARKYRVLSKGTESTIAMVVEPASDRGQIMLMKGRNLWVFMPDVSQPIRLALSQRLTGQVANGDLARANLAGDYSVRLMKQESIDGETYQVLELTAVDRAVTYARVVYWVKPGNHWPL